MKKIIRKLFVPIAVLALAVGVSISINNQKDVVGVKAATQTWQEVTVAPADWSGQYLIVSKTDNVAFNGSLATLDAVSNTIPVTISAGQISLDDSYSFTISAHTGGNYDIKSASGQYIYNTNSEKNDLKTSTTIPTETNTISLSNNKVIILSSNYLVYNSTSDQNRFRYFKAATSSSGQGTESFHAISLYKKTDVVLNSISIKTNPSKTKFTLGETFSHTGLVINAVYNSGTVEKTSGFTVGDVDTMVLGRHYATVSFEGKSTTYPVDVTNQGALVEPGTPASDLFISEYYEGASNGKAIEIFNGTSAPINLTDYKIKMNANGKHYWGTTEITLGTGTLAVGQTYVLAYSSSNATILALANSTSANLSYNGNDAIGLFKNDILIDIVGIFNNAVDFGWPLEVDGPVVTVNNAITRNSDVRAPSATWVESEWTVRGLVTTYLGSHEFASADVTVLEQATAFANYVMTGIGLNAQGSCSSVLQALLTEYNYMDEESILEFETAPEELFVNARARMAYLQAWVSANTPDGLSAPIQEFTNSSTIIIVASLGLGTVIAYFFLKRKKA